MSIPERKKTIAFAKFRERQRNKTPIVIDFGGESVEIPPDMPATVMLDLMEFMEEHGEEADLSEMPVDMAMRILGNMLGDAGLREMIRKHGVTITELYWLLGEIMEAYRGDVEATAPVGKLASDSTSSKNGS